MLLSFSSGYSASLRDFFCLSVIWVPGCVSFPKAVFFFSLFTSFLLLRGLAAFPKLRLLRSCFSWSFLFFTGFIFGSFTYEFRWCSLAGLGAPFSYLFLDFGFLLFLSFIGFSLASALSSLVLFLLPSSVPLLSASLPPPGLCVFLSRFLPVRPASLSSTLVARCVFRLLFPYFLVRSLRPRILSSFGCFFFLYFRVVTVPLSCVFLRSCTALSSPHLPHLFFGLLWLYCAVFASLQSCASLILLLDYSFVLGFGLCSLAGCGAYGFGCYSTFVSSFRVPPFFCSGSYYPLSFSAYRIPGCSF